MFWRSGIVAACVLLFSACDSPAKGPSAAAPAPPAEPPRPAYGLKRPTVGLEAPVRRDATFRRGVALGLFVSSRKEAVRRPLYTTFLDEIAALGATDLQLVVQWGQHEASSSEITPHATETVDDDLLVWVMAQAKRRGLRVLLMPTLHLEQRSMGKWRGRLEPADRERWWWSYGRFIRHYARVAQSNGAGLFSVGSELLSVEADEAHWRDLIGAVRKLFTGQITYSANWDHFETVPFWDAVDVVGVTAYQGLSEAPNASDAQLRAGFAPFAKRVRAWATQHGFRYLFTEVGYPAQAHAAARPWDDRKQGPVNPLLQLRCFRSLYQVWQADPRLAGLYVWNWFGPGGAKDPGYSPRGKPVEKLLSHWYRGSAKVQ